LIQKLAEETEHLEVRQETKKTFWDTWTFFLTVVALLGVEWYVRKRWGCLAAVDEMGFVCTGFASGTHFNRLSAHSHFYAKRL